ncbi:MAG: hypothetical protein LBF19_03700 [Prevotellaceae bacterium]|nr:hypothetical protein [Prevotellaceae bacterium]
MTINFGDRGLFADLLDVSERIDDFDPADLSGIIDVKLSMAAKTSTTVDVKVKTGCDETDLFDIYTSELSDSSLWRAVKKDDGTTVTITGVVAQSATKSFRLSLTSPAGDVLVSLADIATLSAAGVEGYESTPLTVTF